MLSFASTFRRMPCPELLEKFFGETLNHLTNLNKGFGPAGRYFEGFEPRSVEFCGTAIVRKGEIEFRIGKVGISDFKIERT